MAAALVLLPARARAADTVWWLVDGEPREAVDVERVAARGLTLLDLSDAWAPALFRAEVPYRATLVDLAREAPGAGDVVRHAREPGGTELFGIFPTFTVLGARLADQRRHACHATVDDGPLAEVTLPLARDARATAAARREPARAGAVRALQAHLACDGLLGAEEIDGRLGAATERALGAFRLGQMVPTGGPLDAQTRALLLLSSEERDFRGLLRALRERVADAAGLIEDGSAAGAFGQVLGRDLDARELRDTDGWPPLARAAPDAISPAVEAAARALGWTSPEAARAALARLSPAGAARVAVALPPPPAHDREILELRAEIDRGDVERRFARRHAPVARRPSLVLYAASAAGPVALVRWPTTIGGWQREKTGRGVVWRYKESRPGDHVWRDVVVAPTWYPPPTTPDRELVRRGGTGWVLREDTIGPGHLSAYGLVMLMHHQALRDRRAPGGVRFDDTAVRTHGSVSYASIRGGSSHGCHRLYNHLAIRLASFVLRHRPHAYLGAIDEPYTRRVVVDGRSLWLRRELRGYLYRLREPVPVRILEGRRPGPHDDRHEN